MGFLLALLVLAPLIWALLGAPDVPMVTPWLAHHLPEQTAGSPVAPVPTMLALAVGMALAMGRPRRATVHVSTVAHEFGHGLTAAVLGGRVERVIVRPDGSGSAHTSGRGGVRRFVSCGVGYLSPGLLALASVRAVESGWAVAWLGYLVAVLAVMLVLVVRSWWGVLVALVLAGLGWALVQLAPATVVSLALIVLAGVLAAGGVRDALDQWRARRGPSESDAHTLASMTGLPTGFFAGLHILAALALAVAVAAVPLTVPKEPTTTDAAGLTARALELAAGQR
jgi:hypothetical protein